MGYGHAVISSSPIDVNLAKQVNILLENLGMPMDRVIVDPTTGGLGYGMEYSYSVMERLTMAAMVQGDEKLQFPMINNLGNEVWKCKEARQKAADAPILGDPEKRGVMMEAIGAVSYLLAGSSLLIMRHPEAIRLTKEFINAMSGGSLKNSAPIAKILAEVNIDFAALAPKPDLTIAAEEKKAAPAAKKAAPAAAAAPAPAAKPAAAPAPAKEAPKAAAQPQPAVVDPAAQAKAEAEAKVKAEAKAAADAKTKADAEVKAKADAEAKTKADAAAQAKAAADALQAEKTQREEDEKALKRLRAQARHAADETAMPMAEMAMTADPVQKTQQEKILDMLDRFHRRTK
jgi:acetyl-CoA decarbonylase/synthase complex subunit delta